jgi:hypothetical protein
MQTYNSKISIRLEVKQQNIKQTQKVKKEIKKWLKLSLKRMKYRNIQP